MQPGEGRFYRRFCNPSGLEWGAYLAKWGNFHSVGSNFFVNTGCKFLDPSLVRIGNSVGLSDCTLIGHDGVVLLIEHRWQAPRFGWLHRYQGQLLHRPWCDRDAPRVTIGPESIVAAGAVVTKDVPPGTVYGGNPAVFICTTEQLIQRVEARCESYPWIDLVKQRKGAYDPEVEPLLMAQRRQYFFGDKNG
jgi:hypothetical protein